MKDFINSCRDKEKLLVDIKDKQHLINDINFFSLGDLVAIAKDKLLDFLRKLFETWMKHILNCELCKHKGSYCEYCNKNEIIYAFQLTATVRCPECHTVFHKRCYDSRSCPKCNRIRRQRYIQESKQTSSS